MTRSPNVPVDCVLAPDYVDATGCIAGDVCATAGVIVRSTLVAGASPLTCRHPPPFVTQIRDGHAVGAFKSHHALLRVSCSTLSTFLVTRFL